jgi:hypothetical protein
MPEPTRPHDPLSCPRCESVPPDTYRRHWKHEAKAGAWHVIADGPALMTRLAHQAYFLTILSYQLGLDGAKPHYNGPLYWEGDSADPSAAFADLQRCLGILDSEYDCLLEAVRIWHSGSRGPHCTIPAGVFGATAGHPQLPRIYAAMVQRLFPPNVAPTIDRSIYSTGKGRMWRLPNRRRSDTGRYKVPLSVRETLHRPYADLDALTVRPRRGIFWPPEEELSPCPGLVELYQETAAAIERRHAPEHPRHRDDLGSSGTVDVLLNRCAFIRHCRDDALTLTEPEWYAMISNVGRCANGPEAVHRLSAPYPGYSPQETEAKILHALQDTGPHSCAYIKALGFTRCPAGGCGVKAPIGLTQAAHKGGRVSGYAPPPPLRGIHQPFDTDLRGGEVLYAW